MSLSDDLGSVKDDLDDAKDTVGGSPGPLQEPARGTVASRLDSADTSIQSVLAQINNAGAADPNNLPPDLPSIAAECANLAESAYKDSTQATPDHAYIGDCVKTIVRIMDAQNGYRQRAGIS